MKRNIILILSLILLTACNNQTSEENYKPQENAQIEEQPEEQIEEIPESQTTSLIFGGDNLIHGAVYRNAKTSDGYDFTYIYENLQTVFSQADIAMINQETVINDTFAPATYPMFSTPIQMADTLKYLGIDIITVANNHVFDVGAKGIEDSLDYFSQNTDILTVGAYRNQQEFDEIRTIEVNDTIFSFIGATELTNGLSIKNSDVILLKTSDEQILLDRITKAEEISDVVIVNVHWGNEYQVNPNDMQENLALKMTDAGADIIVGHHPHVLQKMEEVVTESGNKALVAYSLGNLVSAQDKLPRMIGGLLDIEITKHYDADQPYIEITNKELIPVITHFVSGFNKIKAYTLEQYTDEIAKTHALYQNNFGIEYIKEHVAKSME